MGGQRKLTDSDQIEDAITAFVEGYRFHRSFTRPVCARRPRGLWRLFDDPRSKGTARREEFVVRRATPEKVHGIVTDVAQGHYCVTAICGNERRPRRGSRRLQGPGLPAQPHRGVHGSSAEADPRVPPPVTLQRVATEQMAAQLAKTAGRRQILPEHLEADPPPQRSYVALVDGTIAGWVNSVATRKSTYCSGMYVAPAYRRRGIARSLMAKMLRDDRAGGAQQAVLLASHAGSKLYPVVGYTQIGTAMIFTPKRS